MIILRQKFFDAQPQQQPKEEGSSFLGKVVKGGLAVGATIGTVYGAKRGMFGSTVQKFTNQNLMKAGAKMQNWAGSMGTEGFFGRNLHNMGGSIARSSAKQQAAADLVNSGKLAENVAYNVSGNINMRNTDMINTTRQYLKDAGVQKQIYKPTVKNTTAAAASATTPATPTAT